jgi:hypothetical protein
MTAGVIVSRVRAGLFILELPHFGVFNSAAYRQRRRKSACHVLVECSGALL